VLWSGGKNEFMRRADGLLDTRAAESSKVAGEVTRTDAREALASARVLRLQRNIEQNSVGLVGDGDPAVPTARTRRAFPARGGGLVGAVAPAVLALTLGVVLAKFVDWRSYVEPRV
jgi:hypothetical protein